MTKASSTYWKVIGPDLYEYGDTLPDGTMAKAGEGDYATAFAYAWQINSQQGKKRDRGNFLRLISSAPSSTERHPTEIVEGSQS